RATTNPSSIEPLTLHVGFIVLTVVLAYGVNTLISNIWEQVSIPLFAMSIVLGLVIRAIMNALGAKDYLDRETTSSVSGSATDYLIAFGIASIAPAALSSYWVPLLSIFVLGIIFCVFFLLWFPAEFFGKNWIIRDLCGWIWCTTAVSTGIALLKFVYPKLKS